MSNWKKITIITLFGTLGLSALAACTSTNGGSTRASATPPASIEGTWRHGKGLFNATFAGGRFDSVSPQTGDRLAAGSYVETRGLGPAHQINLDFATSRGSRETAVCKLTSPDIVNCKPSNGGSFTMYRVQSNATVG